MAIPLAALALQAVGTGLAAYQANQANKKNKAAMDAAARRVNQFQINPLGNKLAQAYSESKLAEKDLNQYQKQEAQDLLRAQADANYNLSNVAPSGFAALGAQSVNQAKTQDQLGRLNAKYAPMDMAARQQTNQLAGEVDRYNYMQEQERKDKEQSLANIDLGRAQAEAANRNQMAQLAIGLGASMAGTLGSADKGELAKLFGKTTKLPTDIAGGTSFKPVSSLPKVDATNLYNNAMKTNYNVGGKMKTLNPFQSYFANNLKSNNDFTQGVNFSGPSPFNPKGSVPINESKRNSLVTLPLDFDEEDSYYGNKTKLVNQNLIQNPWSLQNKTLTNSYNPYMFYKPKGKFDVQAPMDFQ